VSHPPTLSSKERGKEKTVTGTATLEVGYIVDRVTMDHNMSALLTMSGV
jgi:hypothetical protein